MNYAIHMAVRNMYMRLSRKRCSTCMHYDGAFGENCCFECERSIRAVKYERRGTEKVL